MGKLLLLPEVACKILYLLHPPALVQDYQLLLWEELP